MSVAVRISDNLAKKAKSRSKALKRSVAGQIEYWAKIGEIAEDNPDLPFSFIHDRKRRGTFLHYSLIKNPIFLCDLGVFAGSAIRKTAVTFGNQW